MQNKIFLLLLITIIIFGLSENYTFAEHAKGLLKITTDKQYYEDKEIIFIIGSGGIEYKSYISVITSPDYTSIASQPAIADSNGNFYTSIEIESIHDTYFGKESPPINGIYTLSVRGNSFDDNHVYSDLQTIIIGENLLFDTKTDRAEIYTDKEYYNTRDVLTLSGILDKYPSPYVAFSLFDKDGYEITINTARINSDDYTFSKEIDLYGLKLNQFGIPTFLDHGEYILKIKDHKYYDQSAEVKFNIGVKIPELEKNNTDEKIITQSHIDILKLENEELKRKNKALQSIINQMQDTLNTIYKLIQQVNS